MTFSIIARDAATGAFGAATATGGPVVGSLVPHAASGIGAIATQGYTNPLFGFDGLAMLEQGQGAEDIVRVLIEGDAGRDRRQLIIVDGDGHTAGWTGKALTPESGMILNAGVAVAGNLLADASALEAMLAAYTDAASEPLERRLLAGLVAGEAGGGDARGARSAAIRTYLDQPYPRYDIRIDFSDDPITALEGLLAEVDGPDYGDFYNGLPRRDR